MRDALVIVAAPYPALAALVLAASLAPVQARAQADTTAPPPGEWRTYNRTLEGDRYSSLDQITAANVAQLRRVCLRMQPDSLTAEAGEVWAGGEDPNPYGIVDDTAHARGWITAIDADSGTVRWKYEADQPAIAGMTTTAGGLVFTGQLTGEAVALDLRDGKVLWRDRTNNAIGGGVVTYAVGGKQYVAVAAGLHAANWPAPAETNRIVVYALP